MNIGYYFASLGIFISRLASPIYHIGVLKVTAIICYHILMAYFIVSVYSYYRLLKRQKILAQNILELQLQGSNSSLNSGMRYQYMCYSYLVLQGWPISKYDFYDLSFYDQVASLFDFRLKTIDFPIQIVFAVLGKKKNMWPFFSHYTFLIFWPISCCSSLLNSKVILSFFMLLKCFQLILHEKCFSQIHKKKLTGKKLQEKIS